MFLLKRQFWKQNWKRASFYDLSESFLIIISYHLKRDCIEGDFVNACKQPSLFTFSLDKPERLKVVCAAGTNVQQNKFKKGWVLLHSFWKFVTETMLTFVIEKWRLQYFWWRFNLWISPYQDFETKSYSLGGDHISGTVVIEPD